MTKKINAKMGRREVLAGMAAGGAVLASPTLLRAADKTIVLGTWGGDYGKLLNKNIEKPILEAAGYKVIQDQAGDPERRAKMAAERMLPRGSTDIQAVNGSSMYQLYQQGITEKIDYSKLKNADHVLPQFKHEYGIAQIYSGLVVVFDPNMENPPKSFAEVFDPKWGDQMAYIDIQYTYTQIAAALAAGGTVTDVEKGYPMLLASREAGARIYPTNEAFAQGLAAGEFKVGVMWKARTVQWQDKGIAVASVAPTEGAIPYESGFCLPKNGKNMDGGYAYLDALLEPSAQLAFAHDMGYNPTVDNAEVPADLNAKIGFTDEEVANLKSPDYGFILENDSKMKDWWDMKFKA
ncbi:extracellular solute-binding protein [Rhodobacteraceae bacterium D3-12]|nr:extracellular solute-binding protein [Rhodobacteraceae bacterium D3-12]